MEHNIVLKGTDLSVSPMGFGTVRAGLKWDGKDADDIMNCYVDNGGNIIDTARIYLDTVGTEIGRSERVIGDWFRRCKRRNEVVLMTKGGHPKFESMHTSRMGNSDMEYDLNLSLKSMGVDYVDIYFYHRDDESLSVGELLDRMEEFRKQGKIRYYGCSNWSNARMKEADEYAKSHNMAGFIANQNLYNIGVKCMRPLSDDTLKYVNKDALEFYRCSNNTLMPYSGLCNAFFHVLETKGEEAVKSSNYYTDGNLKVADEIKKIKEKYNCSTTQVLMGFFFSHDFTVIPLISSSSIAQLKDLMDSVNIAFEKNDFDFFKF